jgi:hypothetical protein
MIRMLIVGYCFGIRSERRLCEEVHLNLGYRWFCRLGLEGAVPDHSTFSKNRHGRFRDSDLLREVFDKSRRKDGAFSRSDFSFDIEADAYVCPGGKALKRYRRVFKEPRTGIDKDGHLRYRASSHDCQACVLKPQCCPKEPARKVMRSIHEGGRDMARDIAKTDAWLTSRRERKKVEMLFAHLKRILKLDRLRLRGPQGARDAFLLAATAQILRKLAKLIPMPAPVTAG